MKSIASGSFVCTFLFLNYINHYENKRSLLKAEIADMKRVLAFDHNAVICTVPKVDGSSHYSYLNSCLNQSIRAKIYLTTTSFFRQGTPFTKQFKSKVQSFLP